ncbi:MAG: hypothetical protein IJW31_03380 [Lentisphaeria bacterium]|nr:hypothetical protein [Lentisphaeria bacterium]
MASKISVSWQTVAKDKSIIPQKSGMMSFYILPHLHSPNRLRPTKLTSTSVQPDGWLHGVWGAATKPPIKTKKWNLEFCEAKL